MHTSPNGKVYIGITSQKLNRRWRDGKGYNNHVYFGRAIKKYGWENFKHEVLFEGLSKEEAAQKEIELIKSYKSNNENYGYNLSSGGESGSKGYKYTKEQREHLSELRKGENNYMYGKHHTKETIEKIRISKRKENLSEETLHKMSVAKLGKKRSKSSIEKQKKTIGKKVICIENQMTFSSVKEASKTFKIDSSSIAKVCRGVRKTSGGYHWAYCN